MPFRALLFDLGIDNLPNLLVYTIHNNSNQRSFDLKERTKEPTGLIVHCSDSTYGDIELFRQWHLGNGWDDIGYNWVITNGVFKNRSRYNKERDGILQTGRDTKYIGAHAKGYNESHLGICLTGRWHFTWAQFAALFHHIRRIKEDYIPTLTADDIIGHYEVNQHGKTCPNIDMVSLRGYVSKII